MRKLLGLTFLLWANLLFSQNYGDYYQSAEGLKDDALKTALNTIIKGHTEFNYTSGSTDTWDILKETDKDPANTDNVILLYSGSSVNAAQEYNNGNGWTREHVWAKSRGDFGTEVGPGTDAHNLRPEDNGVNGARGNRSFDNCVSCQDVLYNGEATGSYIDASAFTFEPRDEVKGDVARMIFYMSTRYEGNDGELDLEPTESVPTQYDKAPLHGRLSTLLEWHRADPVSDWERNRNDIIYSDFQHNRNPYIDLPDLAEYIWGDKMGVIWSSGFSTYPSNKEVNVAIDTDIRFIFSSAIRNIDNSEITNANVSSLLVLKEADINGADIAFNATIDADKRIITITPNSPLENSQVYYTSIQAVEDANDLENPLVEITFTTVEVDITAPSFEFDPANNETGVAVTMKPSILFDEAIRNLDNSEITDLNVADLLSLKETDANGADVSFTASIDETKKQILITPNDFFKNGQVLYLTIASIEDASDNATTQQSITFTTINQGEVIVLSIPFSQDFETASGDIALAGWTNANLEDGGDKLWIGKEYNSNKYAEITSYQSTSTGADQAWLITPGIDMDNTLAEELSFDLVIGYWKQDGLSVKISTDFDQTIAGIASAEWMDVTSGFAIPSEPTSSYGSSASSGTLDVSSFNGTMYVAFVYNGNNGANQTTTYQIDNVLVAEAGGVGINDVIAEEINIYPNPSKGKFFIETAKALLSNSKIEVFNIVGMKVYETTTQNAKVEIDLSNLKRGVYYIRIDDGDKLITKKIIKE